MATKKKSFDAVESSRRWRRKTSKLLNKMTPEQQLEFLNRRQKKRPAGAKPARPRSRR